MSPTSSGAGRADARRNRRQLIEAATAAFISGSEAVTLEAIARSAGVGIGTLYRHFPTREALLEAVYRAELERLSDAADQLLADLPPDRAMREWMDRYAEFVATKHGMAEALRPVVGTGVVTAAQTRDRLHRAIAVMLDAGAAAGTLRDDVRADDVATSLAGLLWAAGRSGEHDRIGRLLDLLMAGLRRTD